jgi:hypothetical protein
MTAGITFCDTSCSTSEVLSWNIKSSGNLRSLKEGLEKRPKNQDNGVCEKLAEDYCGDYVRE